MDLQLNDKVIVVTGGAMRHRRRNCSRRGGGRCDHSGRLTGPKAAHSKSFHPDLDLNDPENCRRAVEDTLAKFGAIDALREQRGRE